MLLPELRLLLLQHLPEPKLLLLQPLLLLYSVYNIKLLLYSVHNSSLIH